MPRLPARLIDVKAPEEGYACPIVRAYFRGHPTMEQLKELQAKHAVMYDDVEKETFSDPAEVIDDEIAKECDLIAFDLGEQDS